jgi:hypothetical protein
LYVLDGEKLIISRIKRNSSVKLERGEITDATLDFARTLAKQKGAKEITLEAVNDKIKSFYEEKGFTGNQDCMSMLV